MPITSLFRRNPHREAARRLYGRIVEAARQPVFFAYCGVPDTLDGRFDLLALHAFLVLGRLKGAGAECADFAQALFDTMFTDMDRVLREIGVGDLSVGRQVKRMAKGFYGRIASYERGLAEGDHELRAALRRNLYGTVSPGEGDLCAMADYMRRCAAALAAEPASLLLAGEAQFAPPPSATAGAAKGRSHG
ncbi:MAG TPA: ubiquinol-cytochrome C chaperone family protein [Stellaceae bacterium]|nr:ubiquinol-cytochrome C chaperone family protein [Stellaceae bacterium]